MESGKLMKKHTGAGILPGLKDAGFKKFPADFG